MKPRKETRYASHVYVLVSSLESAIDMMRYDSCYPASEAESSKLIQLGHGHYRSEIPTADRVICFARMAATNRPATADRWRSFNCRVVAERAPEESPLSQAEIENLLKIGGVS